MFFIKFSQNGERIPGKLTNTQLRKLAQLDVNYDPHPWKTGHWLELKKTPDEAMFLLGEDKILGWAIFKLIPADHLAHLLKILILPDYRGNKLGLTLLKNAISQLEGDKYLKFYLEVEKGNPAISIYKRLGFSIIHEIPNFYGMGRNAIVMMRQS